MLEFQTANECSAVLNILSMQPGRQVVTFLILCNLGLWITYNFEIQKVLMLWDQNAKMLMVSLRLMPLPTSWNFMDFSPGLSFRE